MQYVESCTGEDHISRIQSQRTQNWGIKNAGSERRVRHLCLGSGTRKVFLKTYSSRHGNEAVTDLVGQHYNQYMCNSTLTPSITPDVSNLQLKATAYCKYLSIIQAWLQI